MPCHLLLALPIVIAVLFVVLPWTTALPLAAVLAVGTVAIAYPVLRAHLSSVVTGREALVGATGQAVSDLDLEGLVRIRGELWMAEAPTPVVRGARVELLDVGGAKVRVREREEGMGQTSPS